MFVHSQSDSAPTNAWSYALVRKLLPYVAYSDQVTQYKGQTFSVSVVATTTVGRYSGIPSVMTSKLVYSLTPPLELKLYLQNLDFQDKNGKVFQSLESPNLGNNYSQFKLFKCLRILGARPEEPGY